MKNGDQHNTNVKKTIPRTLEAFCSVATELAAMVLRFTLLARSLKQRINQSISIVNKKYTKDQQHKYEGGRKVLSVTA